jgi:hypothetical protein
MERAVSQNEQPFLFFRIPGNRFLFFDRLSIAIRSCYQNSVSEDDVKKQGGKKATLSHLVGEALQNSNRFLRDLETIADFLKHFHACC